MFVSEDEGALPPGTVLGGRYRVTRLLGEGGLATVYEVEGLAGQGRRAVKMLQSQFRSNRQVVERFYAEARACHELRHPSIAAVEEYDYAEDGSPFIVMELLVGQSLDEYLRSHPPLAPEHAAALALEALAALAVAHARGIVHRDLKPANLFLVAGPSGLASLKVLDFGIAKVMDSAGGMGSRTRTGVMLGTPGYMSPEQIRDAKSCDARSDLWSLGVVLYEMLTHRHPYGDNDLAARAVAILRDAARPIREAAPHLGAWDGFFQRALARDPAARFTSADEMAAALRSLVGPGLAPPPLVATTHTAPRAADAPGTLAARAHTLTSGAAGGPLPTYMSGGSEYASGGSLEVGVTTAASLDPPSVVWWGVLLIALGSFASGLLLGYLLAS